MFGRRIFWLRWAAAGVVLAGVGGVFSAAGPAQYVSEHVAKKADHTPVTWQSVPLADPTIPMPHPVAAILAQPDPVASILDPPTCDRGSGDSLGLVPSADIVYRVVCALFVNVSAYGGLRPGDGGDHGSGRAIDIMIGGDSGLGDRIAEFVLAHGRELNVNYVIWQQRMAYPGGGWSGMEDRGSDTANHMDHVHVSVN